MAEHWAGRRQAARAALLLFTVLGLFGMHGLPDAMASSTGTTAMMSTSVMSTPADLASSPAVDKSATRPGAHEPAHVSGPVAPLSSRDTSSRTQSGGPRVGAPVGCAMDHTNCVAVQRESGRPASPGAVLTDATRTQSQPALSSAPATAGNPRAPPDVSLIELGISRT